MCGRTFNSNTRISQSKFRKYCVAAKDTAGDYLEPTKEEWIGYLPTKTGVGEETTTDDEPLKAAFAEEEDEVTVENSLVADLEPKKEEPILFFTTKTSVREETKKGMSP